MALDLISFDACLMGIAENTYPLKDTAKVIAASQELEEGNRLRLQNCLQHPESQSKAGGCVDAVTGNG